MNLTHEHIVVTGGSTGIGAAICDAFLAQGLSVINLSRRPLERANDRLLNIELDLSDRSATEDVAQDIASRFSVTGLIHNAGLIRADLVEDVKLDDLDYLSQVHIGAAITLTQAFIPAMKAAGFGRIVLITSRAALGLQTRTSYTATKAGMMGMARTWALELGAFGITVNTVAPGPIQDTEMFAAVIPEGSEKIPSMAASIPVKRLGRSSDVANAVCFLAAGESGFITGQTLMVCGGASLGSLSL
jgi:NAD(P)-dependent dehydrogenase (short-subunit alcohol dehydrogenase family)